MAQVVIVGAGPAGACLALTLAERGIGVTLVEAASSFRRQFRGQALMPSGLAALAALDLSAMVETVPHEPLDAWEFWIEGQRLFRVVEPMEADGPPCTLVSQPEFLAAVVARAQACPGFRFLPGTTVQGLLRDGERITGVQLGSQASEGIAADLVIAADGRSSRLRGAAGLVLEQQSKSIDVLWFSLPDLPSVRTENVFYAVVSRGQSFGVFRNAQGQAQLGWGLGEGAEQGGAGEDWRRVDWHRQVLEHSPPWLAQHLADQGEAFSRPSLFAVTVGLAQRWWQPGLLLLGDAAHPMSPIRAQGLNMALRDAVVAANHLVPILGATSEADVDATRLDAALAAIQAERSPEIRRAQALQAEELTQGELLRRFPILRWGASRFAPLVGLGVKRSWLRRQRQLRLGLLPVELEV